MRYFCLLKRKGAYFLKIAPPTCSEHLYNNDVPNSLWSQKRNMRDKKFFIYGTEGVVNTTEDLKFWNNIYLNVK